jgi:transposase-like protein
MKVFTPAVQARLEDRKWLATRYLDDHLSIAQIARVTGVSLPTIQRTLRLYNIPTRARAAA